MARSIVDRSTSIAASFHILPKPTAPRGRNTA
jgi:hypothetical protein